MSNKIKLLFETLITDKDNKQSYCFENPIKIIKTNKKQEIEKCFAEIEKYSKKYYVAGYCTYELGYVLEELFTEAESAEPLLYFGVFKRPKKIAPVKQNDFRLKNIRCNESLSVYKNRIKEIKKEIIKGNTYQVNFTAKFKFDYDGKSRDLYEQLKLNQPVKYAAYFDLGDRQILSLSPELFFKIKKNIITVVPMKGTMRRGINVQEDQANARRLLESKKENAENLMIVDLMRNDLGRICRAGVKVSKLFAVEKYPTLFQMVSIVEGRLKKGIRFIDIFKNMFPGGSVTGAPKFKTMEIIKRLEKEPRGVYCGALGYFYKDTAVFNLPIRTVVVDGNKGEMGVGSGITYDSKAEQEYQECLLKARFLTQKNKPFEILETMLWDKKFIFLDEHLDRMERSAEYFGYTFSKQKILSKLKSLKFETQKKYRVRVLLSKGGNINISPPCGEMSRIRDRGGKIILSKVKTDPNDIFLYHKTTHRELYNSEYAKYSKKGFTDVIFLNKNKELTEGSISNLVIKKGNKYYTPPVSAGLLPGIYRGYLIKNKKVEEKILLIQDLKTADQIFICNSVRGLIPVDAVI